MMLESACYGGNIDIVKFMQEKGTTVRRDTFVNACLCNNDSLDIVKLIISNNVNYWNTGLEYACHAGNINIVKFMIEKVQMIGMHVYTVHV